ncbi:MAG: YkgJ family cysteine cluster protein [Hominilimicola sp.]
MIYNTYVTDYTCEGKCSNCGQCCSDMLPMSKKEVKRIKAYIKKNHIKEQRHNGMNGIDLTCPFRDEGNRKCLIYDIRPSICQRFKCDKRTEDIQKEKINYHRRYSVVFMRNEFFGSTEDVELVNYMKNQCSGLKI